MMGCMQTSSRCSAQDMSEAARKTSGTERFDLLCRMELDLVSNLSIKPELGRIERYEATPSYAIR